eukprot:TRINITY_DN4005_c0_g1_i4.p1 TRINITY_DN4005_c0_g1~~TRINITY_DN4005_c0_g1_i4.p1  ORF type:complete len:169 (+),score=3.30 TRINITY_DN4005_c0_g1_i4:39-509(+)
MCGLWTDCITCSTITCGSRGTGSYVLASILRHSGVHVGGLRTGGISCHSIASRVAFFEGRFNFILRRGICGGSSSTTTHTCYDICSTTSTSDSFETSNAIVAQFTIHLKLLLTVRRLFTFPPLSLSDPVSSALLHCAHFKHLLWKLKPIAFTSSAW